jgi:gamma-glutamylaminecyclotransferase
MRREMKLEFSDGITIETSGPLRKLHLEDGWYVVGAGFCIPTASEDEADKTILEMTESKRSDGQESKADIDIIPTCEHLIFVYGTLRKRQENHYLLDRSKFLGMAKTKKRYVLYGDGVPFLSRIASVSQVTGEVYAVDDATLSRLDELEGHPDAYKREQAEVVLEDGTELSAWIYFCDTPQGDLIESGDFLQKT